MNASQVLAACLCLTLLGAAPVALGQTSGGDLPRATNGTTTPNTTTTTQTAAPTTTSTVTTTTQTVTSTTTTQETSSTPTTTTPPTSRSRTSTPTSSPSTTTTQNVTAGEERIDGATVLISHSYDDDRGVATVVLWSERKQYVVLTDSGAVFSGGKVPQKGLILEEGRNRVTFPVTETADGWAGLTVSTSSTLYAVVLDTGQDVDLSPENPDDQIALAVGALIGPLAVAGLYRYRTRREQTGVRTVE